MSYPLADEPETPRLTPAVQWFIAINVAIYFLQITLVRPADVVSWFGFRAVDLPERWWTTITYMFVHGGFWHLALNMYTLFLFGPKVEHEWSAPAFVRYFLLCGLGGLMLHLLFFRGSAIPLVGASAAIYGVMLAYARRWPDDELYLFAIIPIKVKWLMATLVLIDLVNGLGGGFGNPNVAHFAHLGGFVTGWFYLRATEAARGEGIRARIDRVRDLGDDPPRPVPRGLQRPRQERDDVDDIVAKSKAALAQHPGVQVAPLPPTSTLPSPQADLDLLLDKISKHGIDSLSDEERRLLEDTSRRMRSDERSDS